MHWVSIASAAFDEQYARLDAFLVEHSPGGPFLFDRFGWAEAVCYGRISQDLSKKYNIALVFKRAEGEGTVRAYQGLDALLARLEAKAARLGDPNPWLVQRVRELVAEQRVAVEAVIESPTLLRDRKELRVVFPLEGRHRAIWRSQSHPEAGAISLVVQVSRTPRWSA